MLSNIWKIKNSIRLLGYYDALFYLVQKIISKVVEIFVIRSQYQNEKAIFHQAITIEDFLKKIDKNLSLETEVFFKKVNSQMVLKHPSFKIGGAGSIRLCYFVSRKIKPELIIETGVASGFSSLSFLSALDKNQNGGHLYSSDLPYLAAADSMKVIGSVVPKHLRHNWKLFTRGDMFNLPDILKIVKRDIDLIHYDSDKSFLGRYFALKSLLPKLSEKGLLLMDDIGDNCFFEWLVKREKLNHIFVIDGNKYVGIAWKTSLNIEKILNG